MRERTTSSSFDQARQNVLARLRFDRGYVISLRENDICALVCVNYKLYFFLLKYINHMGGRSRNVELVAEQWLAQAKCVQRPLNQPA